MSVSGVSLLETLNRVPWVCCLLLTQLDYDSAVQFGVTLPFILQQAAWLYERQLSQVRAEMKKVVGKAGSPSPLQQGIAVGSVSSGSSGVAAQAMRRTGSGGGGMCDG